MKLIKPLVVGVILALVAGSLAGTTLQPGQAASQLKDISGHWAEHYILSLVKSGLITGYEDGTFRPEKPISREEFVTILVRAKQLPLSGNKTSLAFQDVTPQRWSYPYLQAAIKVGLVQTYDYGPRFDPTRAISRAEMATMLVRAAGLEPPKAPGLRLTSFTDMPSTSARDYITVAVAHGLLTGYPDHTFRPVAVTTRAEAAVTVTRLLTTEARSAAWAEQYAASSGNLGVQLSVVRSNLNRGNWAIRWVSPNRAQGPGVRAALVALPSIAPSINVSSPAQASELVTVLAVSGVRIVSSGKMLPVSGTDSSTRVQRAAVGVMANGFLVFALTPAMTREELSRAMVELGCTDAVELPADASSCLYIDGLPAAKLSEPAGPAGASARALVLIEKTPIVGPPQVTVEQAQRWAASRNATPTFISLAPLYWQFATQAGIRPEIAYCQAAKETNFGRFTGVVPETFHNPCGLKTRSGGSDTDPSAHQQFANWEEGVKAHVDHLALYAGAPGYPKANTPDPRHFPKLLGTVRFLEDLGGTGRWAPSPDYGYSIRFDCLSELLTVGPP